MARPRRYQQPADRAVRVRLTESQRADLEDVAAANGVDLSGVIRDAIDEYVSDYREKSVFRGTEQNR